MSLPTGENVMAMQGTPIMGPPMQPSQLPYMGQTVNPGQQVIYVSNGQANSAMAQAPNHAFNPGPQMVI